MWKVSWLYKKVHNIANFGGYAAILHVEVIDCNFFLLALFVIVFRVVCVVPRWRGAKYIRCVLIYYFVHCSMISSPSQY